MTEHNGGPTEQDSVTYWGWISPRPGLVAGYVKDSEDNLLLYAVLVYPPITSTTMRAISLRQLDDPASFEGPAWVGAVSPPTPGQVEHAWAHPAADGVRLDEAGQLQLLAGHFAARQEAGRSIMGYDAERWMQWRLGDLQNRRGEVLSREWLTRVADEPKDEFYMRVGSAYLLLASETDKPVKRIAEIAGVSQAAATAWVHRARVRGLLPEYDVMKGRTEDV